MSLTSPFGRAPFGPLGGTFDFSPPARVKYWEPWPRRMRALLSGATVLDSRRGILLWETGKFPEHYYPLEDIRRDLLVPSPPKEGRQHWSMKIGERHVENCIVSAPLAADGQELFSGYVTIDSGAMDRWFEEDDPVYAHPRDPYHRVDVRSSSHHVIVRLGDLLIADSTRPKLLFETGNPIRYYLPFADVRCELLVKSATVSECPYKGDGQHWHLLTDDGRQVEDAAWSLPHPLPEGLDAAQHICFYPEKVKVEVDGLRITA
jgi:uncharacterized protein (DUF427 family)